MRQRDAELIGERLQQILLRDETEVHEDAPQLVAALALDLQRAVQVLARDEAAFQQNFTQFLHADLLSGPSSIRIGSFDFHLHDAKSCSRGMLCSAAFSRSFFFAVREIESGRPSLSS